jgi:glycosyltransferase involved in cell wall biosynthesis
MTKKYDFFVYNGFDPDAKSTITRTQARRKFNIPEADRVIVFIGAASKWHGVEYLIELQKEFERHGDNIKIVFGGGDIRQFDKDNLCSNFSPMNDKDCAILIRAADFCALPVKKNRMSPGSPLKLYDYIANERLVLAQANTVGYSDEVEKFSIGFSVDFTNPLGARQAILEAFEAEWSGQYPKCNASWSDRMDVWVAKITDYALGKK